jgi:hypothetical protein
MLLVKREYYYDEDTYYSDRSDFDNDFYGNNKEIEECPSCECLDKLERCTLCYFKNCKECIASCGYCRLNFCSECLLYDDEKFSNPICNRCINDYCKFYKINFNFS